MIACFWNVREFNSPLKQVQVFSRLGKLNVDVICLMETRVRSANMARVIDCYSSDWDNFSNHECSGNGRLWIFWRKGLNFSILAAFDQSLSIVGEINGHRCVITTVYGCNTGAERLHLWRQLNEVESMVGESSWLIGGDFNFFAYAVESSDFERLGLYDNADMEALRNCLSSLELIDHPFDNHADRPKPFKFFNCWARHEEFMNVVKESWQSEVSSTAMCCLFAKLKRLKLRLKEFNRCHFEDISKRVNDKRNQLEQIQLANLSHAGCYIDEKNTLQKELHDLEVVEASFYKQKAKIHWLKEGDRNTNFFHSAMIRKIKRNTIRLLYAEDGSRLDTFEAMSAEMVRFYTELLGIEDPGVKSCDVDDLNSLLGYDLPCEAAVAWDIVQGDFLAAIKEFFQTGILLPAFNATAIVLVPKAPNAGMAKDFRPISCCSVMYKTISGIIVNCLASFFPDMILPNQSAFIKGRSIVDNTLLAQEIVKGYSRRTLSSRCALKIDLRKAFDSICWDFLMKVLATLGLPEVLRAWIRACITGARFSVAFNESLEGFFKGEVELGRVTHCPHTFLSWL
ncbi:uncharacterized protein LOC120117774 [Hibiscus syriacus]|uniref:uncharacterized protein LOC120117774 n=1 Tax=Hibiscus syriacus TaxID=106335 RepID=UPI001921FE76|nr:uncharacterized protein LOC120117774 [Hibiscus syriacus]